MTPLVFVLGGARSGKSRFALRTGAGHPAPRRFVATARGLDDEMRARIEAHRRDRPDDWETIEEPRDVSSVVRSASGGVVVVDCLTFWLANLMGDDPRVLLDPWVDDLLDGLRSRRAAVIVVSNETGLGIVPETPLGRSFRDAAGWLNQRVAEVSDEVVLLVAGQPLRVK